MGGSGDGSNGSAENGSELRADEADLGEAAATDQSMLLSLLGHFYRGQLDRETTWRSRLDQTTN